MPVEKMVELRDYQLELFHEIMRRKSCILFLPAGSGKTHIAFRVIKSMALDLKKPLESGGKRVFFLVNTVHLVHQQGELLKNFGSFKVSCLTGYAGVESFNRSQWRQLESEYEVFVMTCQVYLNALIHARLLLENANLLIFDECHHATGDHPMAQIMKLVRDCNNTTKPQILGLSATLLNANLKKLDINDKLRELESIFEGEIITSKHKEIKESAWLVIYRHSAKPNEHIVNLAKYKIADDTKKKLENLYEEAVKILQVVKLKNDYTGNWEEDEIELHRPGSNHKKLLRNALRDILVHTVDYGLYVGFTCCQCYIVQLYRLVSISKEQKYINLIMYTMNLAQMIRKILYLNIAKECNLEESHSIETIEIIEKTTSGKIQYLFDRLRCIKSSDRCIVFVHKKMTAKSLCKLVKILKDNCTNNILNVDFIIGSDNNPLRNTKEGLHDKKKKRVILNNFKTGLTNVLIATNIMEEGMDIQDCNIVIMFDPVKTFRSYMQSKGRARMKESEYIILNDEPTPIDSRINDFKNIDHKLNNVIEKDEYQISDESDNSRVISSEGSDDSLVDIYTTPAGATVNSVTAVQTIYRYCATLPQDLFTELTPIWHYNPSKGICKVTLPLNAGIRFPIKGPPRPNKKAAKQAAALEGVTLLHKCGNLDDHLIPIKIPREINDRDYWFPNWDSDDDREQQEEGSNNVYVSEMRIPVFLEDCRPLPNVDCYLHAIRTRPEYDVQKIQRHVFCQQLMKSNEYNFGILTSKKWPTTISEFPVYSDLGEVRVKFEANIQTLQLNKEKLDDISTFHRTLFLNILKIVPKCFMYDTESSSNGYFLVPVKLNKKTGRMELWWKCIGKCDLNVKKPTDEEIERQKHIHENYVGRVVTPWYKPGIPYIVCEISNNVHLKSKFIDKKYETYADYFEKKHNIKSTRATRQPMLAVRPLTSMLEGIRPRPVTIAEKNRIKTKKDSQTYLAPEFCYVFEFPSILWYKSNILPSVLHRMYYLLMAEDLRQTIVKEAGVGTLEMSEDDEDTLHIKTDDTKHELPQFLQRVVQNGVCNKIHKLENFDRSCHKDVGLHRERRRKIVINFVKTPELLTLKEYIRGSGPRPNKILEALTLRDAQDIIDLERLETLGDSLLKYLVSVCTFIRCTDMNEGHLTMLKGKLVSNKNLFYCGDKLKIGSYVKGVPFSSKVLWYPPGFSIPVYLKRKFANVSPHSLLLAVTIPVDEQFSGKISMDTIQHAVSTDIPIYLENLEENTVMADKQTNFYLSKHELVRKNISDVLEALLGVYLQTAGVKGAFKVLKYFGILGQENLDDLFHQIPSPVLPSFEDHVYDLLSGYENLEELCKYEFKEKAYLLQAFTHPSYTSNAVTDCYQKLEFLGDAVLDFLITSYIYEYCGNLSPGELTDLRASLVNNTMFGALTVRLGLHKYLLCHSQRLLDAIESFVTYQEAKNYEIHGNELMKLVNEGNTVVAEEVEVPKVLGDLFESLAGAIFLDSGCNLSVVWNIYYNFMKEEIDKFSKNIPINPVRALYEKIQIKPIFKIIESEINGSTEDESRSKTKISFELTTSEKKTFQYVGRGDNIKLAKRAAAKYALKDFNYNKFVI